jgi:hypothetical protein
VASVAAGRRQFGVGRGEKHVGLLGIDPNDQAALTADRDRHLAADQEDEASDIVSSLTSGSPTISSRIRLARPSSCATPGSSSTNDGNAARGLPSARAPPPAQAGCSNPDRRRGCSDGRAHGLRADGRHPAARQGSDRPRPVRSAPRPGRGDGPEVARRPGMTASQHPPRQATTTATSGLARRRLASGRPPAGALSGRSRLRSSGTRGGLGVRSTYGTLFRAAVGRVPVPFDPHGRCHSTCARHSEIVGKAELTAHAKPLT